MYLSEKAGRLQSKRTGESKQGIAGGRNFLHKLNNVEVSQLVECIKRAGCPVFVPLRVTLDIKKTDGKALSQIMSYVVAWANLCPTDVKRGGNNKPPLCRDLEPALRDVYSSAAAAEVTGMSIELEREILEYAISRPKELDRLNGPIIDELPTGDGASSAAYASRFIDGELWRGMLEIVRRRLGPAHVMCFRNAHVKSLLGSRTCQTRLSL